ncbi:MAG: hypothetical protein A2749_01495 [Parcubacteria group bacterium RIFCSPHIGHO2_01_FULL_45_26]|nr:MAG: hypothetical protein A2749_01495 [Parcubacteria group bacterium RIFCSPHIGHO2_01_FULL_45_26]
MKQAKRPVMKEKKIGLGEFKRHTNKLSKDFQRHVGALVEDMDDKFKLTNEEIRGVHEKLDSHTVEIGSINQKLDSHTQMIGQIMLDVEQIKFDMKQKVSYDDFAKLEKRVARMELKLHVA